MRAGTKALLGAKSPVVSDFDMETAMLAAGPVRYYRFEDPDATVAFDSAPESVFRGDGAYSGGASVTADGLSGQGLQLNATTSGVSSAMDSGLMHAGVLTLTCAWRGTTVATEAAAGSTGPGASFVSSSTSSGAKRYIWCMAPSGAQRLFGGATYKQFTAATPVNDGNWHTLAVTMDFSTSTSWTVSFFVDGVRDGLPETQASDTGTGSPSLWLGRNGRVGGTGLGGVLDEVGIFQRILSDAEIANLASALP